MERVTMIALKILNSMTKIELSNILGISRPTLDTRLLKNNWKKSEVEMIKRMK